MTKTQAQAKFEQVKTTLEKVAQQKEISNELNNIIEQTLTLDTIKNIALYKKIDAKNKENKQYTKFEMLCIILQKYAQIKEHKEYNNKIFIVACEDIWHMHQLQNDMFYSGYAEDITAKATSEYNNETKAYTNKFILCFKLRYVYGLKAEILENKGVQLIAPTKEEQQETKDLQNEEIALAESLLLSAGLSTNLLVTK